MQLTKIIFCMKQRWEGCLLVFVPKKTRSSTPVKSKQLKLSQILSSSGIPKNSVFSSSNFFIVSYVTIVVSKQVIVDKSMTFFRLKIPCSSRSKWPWLFFFVAKTLGLKIEIPFLFQHLKLIPRKGVKYLFFLTGNLFAKILILLNMDQIYRARKATRPNCWSMKYSTRIN